MRWRRLPPIDRTGVRKLTSGPPIGQRLHAIASTNALPVREVRRSWDPSYVAPKLCQIVQHFHRRVGGRSRKVRAASTRSSQDAAWSMHGCAVISIRSADIGRA